MIQTGQELNYKNLLSFRKLMTQDEMKKEMKYLENFLKENELKIVGPKISTTFSVNQAIVPTMDIEILIPIDGSFTETEKYKLKDIFKLTNAIKVTHKGNPQGLQQNVLLIQKYIQEKKLTPIAGLYTVNINEVTIPDEFENYEAHLYLSISPNII